MELDCSGRIHKQLRDSLSLNMHLRSDGEEFWCARERKKDVRFYLLQDAVFDKRESMSFLDVLSRFFAYYAHTKRSNLMDHTRAMKSRAYLTVKENRQQDENEK